jgi:hypothetical protein
MDDEDERWLVRSFCLAGRLLVLLPVERERVAWSRCCGTVPFGEGEKRGRIVQVVVVEEKSFRCCVMRWLTVVQEWEGVILFMRAS